MKNESSNLDLSGEFTGRFLLVTAPGKSKSTISEIKKSSGLELASSEDFDKENVSLEGMDSADGIYLSSIGVAILNTDSEDQLKKLSTNETLGAAADEDHSILEPERVVHAINYKSYLEGFRDAVDHLSKKYDGEETEDSRESPRDPNREIDEQLQAASQNATYGLEKTRVVVGWPYRMPYTGKGIKVAVLDTGMDLNHPDFAGRTMYSQSFVPGQAVQDMHSHGTHCIGTACGPRTPSSTNIKRYGVAYESSIYAGKVLSNQGSGADGWILGGINWAIANKCEIISMSLGAAVNSSGYSAAYENAAQAALNAGTLIIAAAGNGYSKPVSHPANCPSIMAVGAVDSNLVKANFSNITFYPPHGKVDIAAPGVNTFSSIPMPQRYGSKSGTSMATPHVAGIAALWAQRSKYYRGRSLWQKLLASSLAVPQPVQHVGAGISQAPFTHAFDFRPRFPWPIIRRPLPFAEESNGEKIAHH